MGQQPLHSGVSARQGIRHGLGNGDIRLQRLHAPSGVGVQQGAQVDVFGGDINLDAGVGQRKATDGAKVVHAAAGRLSHQRDAHFLQLYGIDDGRGEGGLSDESHHLGPIIHLLTQDGQQRPDYAV